MIDKKLFYNLCQKYEVELSSVARQPELKTNGKRKKLQNITREDLKQIMIKPK